MELKKGNYYEIFCKRYFSVNSKEYRLMKYLGNHKLKYLDKGNEIELDETNTTFATKIIKGKEIVFNKDYFGFRNIDIMPIHLEKLGFEKKGGNLYEHNSGLRIFYCLTTLGLNDEYKYIGNILLNNDEFQELETVIVDKIGKEKEKLENRYQKKLENLQKCIKESLLFENSIYLPIEIMNIDIELNIEIHNMIVKIIRDKYSLNNIVNINELFEKLEEKKIIIEDKDKILL